MKLHIGADRQTGLVHSASVTAANVHGSHEVPNLLHGEETRLYGDSAYRGKQQRERLKVIAPKAKDFTNKRAYRNCPLTNADKETNRRKSSVRSKVEHPFLTLNTSDCSSRLDISHRQKLRRTTISNSPIAKRQSSQLKPTGLHEMLGDSHRLGQHRSFGWLRNVTNQVPSSVRCGRLVLNATLAHVAQLGFHMASAPFFGIGKITAAQIAFPRPHSLAASSASRALVFVRS